MRPWKYALKYVSWNGTRYVCTFFYGTIFVLSGSKQFHSSRIDKFILFSSQCRSCRSCWCFFFLLPSQRFRRSSGHKIRPLVPIKLLPWHHYLDCDNKSVGRRKCEPLFVRSCLCALAGWQKQQVRSTTYMGGMKIKRKKCIGFYDVRFRREGCVTKTNAVLFSYQRLRSQHILLQRLIVNGWRNFVHRTARI